MELATLQAMFEANVNLSTQKSFLQHCLEDSWRRGQFDVVAFLVRKGLVLRPTSSPAVGRDESGGLNLLVIDAITQGQAEAVEALLEVMKYAEWLANEHKFVSCAAARGQLPMLGLLLGRGADVRGIITQQKQTAIHVALEAAKYSSVDVGTADGSGFSDPEPVSPSRVVPTRNGPLLIPLPQRLQPPSVQGGAGWSNARGDVDRMLKTVAWLLQVGVDVNALDCDGKSALHIAAEMGHYHAVDLLLKAGADVAAVDNKRRTPLHNLCSADLLPSVPRLPLVQLLIENVSSVNCCDVAGNSPLHYACKSRLKDVACVLLKAGASATLKNLKGESPVTLSCTPHFFLASKDSAINIHSTLEDQEFAKIGSFFPGGLPVSLLRRVPFDSSIAMMMLMQGVDGEDVTDLARRICLAGSEVVLEFLLEMFPQTEASLSRKRRISSLLTKGRQTKILRLHSRDAQGRTLLHLAALAGSEGCIRALVKKGLPVNVTDVRGETPLHVTCQGGYASSTVLLIFLGADMSSVSLRGFTPLFFASEKLKRTIRDAIGSATLEVTPELAAGYMYEYERGKLKCQAVHNGPEWRCDKCKWSVEDCCQRRLCPRCNQVGLVETNSMTVYGTSELPYDESEDGVAKKCEWEKETDLECDHCGKLFTMRTNSKLQELLQKRGVLEESAGLCNVIYYYANEAGQWFRY